MAFEIDGCQYYGVSEVAETLGVTRRTIYRWIELGKVNGPGFERVRDKRRFFSQAEFDEVAAFANHVEPVETSPDQMKLFNAGRSGGTE